MRQLKIIKQITKRESQSLEKYLQEMGSVSLLTAEQEVELAKLQKRNTTTSNRLVEANLRFVVSVAKQYQNQGLPLSDLISSGNFGLIKGAARFDHTRGFKCISYAVWWIRHYILQAIAENSRVVRMPLNRIGGLNRIHKVKAMLEQKYERKPTIEEISEEVGLSITEIRNTLQVAARHVSLNTPLVQGEESTLMDVLEEEYPEAPDKMLVDESLKREIQNLIKGLSKRQAQIITSYFGIGRPFPMTLEEIGKSLNLTRERVRQIKEKILSKLRARADRKNLKAYLP